MSDTTLQRLHQRTTLGEALTPEESASLLAWYARLDAEEATILHDSARPPQLLLIQDQINIATAQLERVSQQIRETVQVNEQIRQEIAMLEQQLARRGAG